MQNVPGQDPVPVHLGKYEVLELIGTGSMGMVFRGRDPVLERDVAIKVMAGALLFDDSLRKRFEREAKSVAQIHHPNIVTVHDLGYDDQDHPFIAMELVEGKDLDELTTSDALSVREKLEIVVQVCRGLHYAHRRGIVHRDIKPANILVTHEGTAKIMDFGVARWHTNQTQAGIVVGTAGYIAPEQLRGDSVDGRSDLFSLGVVLFELLTGETLFPGDTVEAVFFKTLTGDIPNVVLPDGEELPELTSVLERALAREPEERFETTEDLAEAIESLLQLHEKLLTVRGRCGIVSVAGAPKPKLEGHIVDEKPRGRKSSPNSPTQQMDIAAYLERAAPAATETGSQTDTGTKTLTEPVKPTLATPAKATIRRAPPRPRSHRDARPRTGPRKWAWIAVPLLLGAVTAWLVLPRGGEDSETATEPKPVASSPVPADEPPSPVEAAEESSEASTSEKAAALLADAALLIASGDFAGASRLIEEGKALAPDNTRFDALETEVREKRAAAQRRARALARVREADRLLDQGEHEAAIQAFTGASEIDPGNPEARRGLERAERARREAEVETASEPEPPPLPARRFVEGETVYAPAESGSEGLHGFEMEEGFEIKQTAEPTFPVKLVVEISPPDVRPGERYLIRVGVYNEGNRPVRVESLELATTYGDKVSGRGQAIPVRVKEVAPQAMQWVHEVEGTWKEEQTQGAIEAQVTLSDGGTLSKSVTW